MDGQKIMLLTMRSLKCSFVRVTLCAPNVSNAPVRSHVPGCMFAENDKLHAVKECSTKSSVVFHINISQNVICLITVA